MTFLSSCSANDSLDISENNIFADSTHERNETNENTNNNQDETNKPDKEEIDELGSKKADTFYIEMLIDGYEKALIYAVNNNKFSFVEKYLIENSNLYNAQKKLISELYNKGVKEDLIEFDIKDIKIEENKNTYKVFVTEKIAIKYSEEADFKVKEFNWIYTVIYNNGELGLSDIKKWEKE